MPLPKLHMTAMEITHSLTAPEIDALVDTMRPHIADIANFTYTHRARLIKPMLSYDAAAVALSFVPASSEALPSGREIEDDSYTYHHLRRDLFNICTDAGVQVSSRYVVPSAHLTVARFNSPSVFEGEDLENPAPTLDAGNRNAWLEKIEEINAWLEGKYWPKEESSIPPGGQWIVGEEQGLDYHKGRLWYGGGERVLLGKGF